MNIDKLKDAQRRFLAQYPGGFSNPQMLEVAKKHRAEKMRKLAQESFSADQFDDPSGIVASMAKIIGQSSMISVFEKPKFRDLAKMMSDGEKVHLAHGLKEFLHGNQEIGFTLMADLLGSYKLAKWPLLTICSVYYRPNEEAFIKPTTVKSIIAYFELEGLRYSPKPSYDFYRAYREQLLRIKELADTTLQADNAAFSAFLMLTANGLNEIGYGEPDFFR